MVETWNYNPFLDFLNNVERLEMERERRNNRARSRSPRARIVEMAMREEERRIIEFMRDEPFIELNRMNARSMPRIQRWRKIGVLLLTMLQHAQRTLAHIAIGRFASMIGAQRLLSNDQRKDEGLPPVHAPSTPPTPPEALARARAKGKGKGKGKGADSSSEEEEAGAIAKGKAKGKEK